MTDDHKFPPRDQAMEERSMAAYRKGNYTTLQEYIDTLTATDAEERLVESFEALVKLLTARITTLRQELNATRKYKLALELFDKGPVTAVAVLACGSYNITVRSGDALVSCEYNGLPLVDALISSGTVVLK